MAGLESGLPLLLQVRPCTVLVGSALIAPDAESVVPAPLAHAFSLAYSQIKPYCWEIMPRPCHCRRVSALPKNSCFKPNGIPLHELEEVVLSLDGLEALRLADHEDLNMDEAAARMGVSRHTFGRLLRRARRSVAQALVLGQALRIEGGVCAVDAPDEPDAGNDAATNEASAPDGLLVAVPCLVPGGPDAAPNAHFGRCQVYTLARVVDGKITEIDVRPNPMHQGGDCAGPVQALLRLGVNTLLAGGMGMRPLQALQAAGIAVYYNANLPTVADCLNAFAAGRLVPFGPGHLCQAGCASKR